MYVAAMKWSNHKHAHCTQLCNMQHHVCHARSADLDLDTRKKGQEVLLIASFVTISDQSVEL